MRDGPRYLLDSRSSVRELSGGNFNRRRWVHRTDTITLTNTQRYQAKEKPGVWLGKMGVEGGGGIRPGKHDAESRPPKKRFLTPFSPCCKQDALAMARMLEFQSAARRRGFCGIYLLFLELELRVLEE